MATLTYSFYKNNSYGAGAGHTDPYFTYDTVSYSGNVGQSTVSSITACRFTNANTNGSSQSGYKMEVEVKLNNQWRVLGYITATFSTVHMNWSNFTQTASAATRNLMGKYPPTGARLHVVNGYFHLNSGSTLSVTASMDLDYQTSTLSLNKTSCDAGTAITASISMNSSDLSHRFTWSFGSASFSSEAAKGVASHAVTIPANWMNQIPNATSGTATVTMQTYANSTLIGTTSANFTVTVPTGIVPIPGTFSVTSVNPYNGLTLQNVSSATATLGSTSGQYGATISRVQISGNGESASAYSLTTGVLKTTGNVSFTAQVWDTRGRTATTTASIYVTPYTAPRITSTTEFRCNSSGTAQRNGTYASCKASWIISALTGATATLTIGYKRSSGTWSPDTGYTGQASSGSVHVIGAGTLDIRYGWSIIYTVSDGIMSTSVTARVPSIERFLHFRPGGQGIGIGTMCEADQRVQINADWDVFVGGQNLISVISNTVTPISKGGTGATTVAAARNALGLGNTSGAVPIANGGTGQTTVAAARNALGLGNTSGAVPVANGGTGATTAANARTNLGAAASSHNHGAGSITSGTLAKERLPFKMECGSTTITGVAWKTVTFSTAFTAKPIIIVSYAGNPSSSGLSPLKTSSESKTGFQVCMAGSSGSGTRTVNWIAIQ